MGPKQEWNPIVLSVGLARHRVQGKTAGSGHECGARDRVDRVLRFPQEVVNQIAERTGGRPVTVEIPSLCDGEVEIDSEGRIFLVSHFTNGDGQIHERLIFMAQVTRKGEVFPDRDEKGSPIVIERVRQFPIQAGRARYATGRSSFPAPNSGLKSQQR